MNRRTSLALTCALLLGVSPAGAQDRLVVHAHEVGAIGRLGQRLGPAPEIGIAAGGRVGLRCHAPEYFFFCHTAVDLRTAATRLLPPNAIVLATDPVRPRLFLELAIDVVTRRYAVATFDLVTGAIAVLVQAPSGGPGFVARYAVDADELFVASARTDFPPGPPTPIVAVNPATGAVVHGPFNVDGRPLDVTPDGTRLFVDPDVGMELVAYDTRSGQAVARGLRPTSLVFGEQRATGIRSAHWEPAIDALVIVTRDVFVFDRNVRQLAALEVSDGGYDTNCAPRVRISAHTARAYVLSGGPNSFYNLEKRLRVIDLSGLRLVGDVDETTTLGLGWECGPFGLLTVPGPPRHLVGSMVGRDVSLRWENIGAASQFVLDVGFAPGRTDAQIYLGPDSHVSFANVSSGIYYLRLRGGNEFGGGRASNEIQLVVP